MTTTVVNKRTHAYDVYIGRGGPWGNPFVIGRDGTRAEVIWLFNEFFTMSDDPRAQWMRDNIHTLKGKKLGCFCKPKPCHGDVLAMYANKT